MKICDQKIYVAQAGKKNHNTEISIEGMWASLMRSWFVTAFWTYLTFKKKTGKANTLMKLKAYMIKTYVNLNRNYRMIY